MEEKSVEIPKIQGPLREQDSIRALLELLEQQGMEQEKGDVIRMAMPSIGCGTSILPWQIISILWKCSSEPS